VTAHGWEMVHGGILVMLCMWWERYMYRMVVGSDRVVDPRIWIRIQYFSSLRILSLSGSGFRELNQFGSLGDYGSWFASTEKVLQHCQSFMNLSFKVQKTCNEFFKSSFTTFYFQKIIPNFR
jgi:hypothetical protein